MDPRVLKDGVLEGVAVVVAGTGELGGAVRERAAALGADVADRAVDPWGEEPAFEGAADVLVWDASAPPEGPDGIGAALDGAWLAIRPVATAAMIERGGGSILLLAPRPGDAAAEAARAGLENLGADAQRRMGPSRHPPRRDPPRNRHQPRRGGGAGGVPWPRAPAPTTPGARSRSGPRSERSILQAEPEKSTTRVETAPPYPAPFTRRRAPRPPGSRPARRPARGPRDQSAPPARRRRAPRRRPRPR